nr:AraC family transcriptional regulator [Bradyrhizobium japonicum]
MTRAPQVLTETPADLLSDVLGSMHLAGTVLFRAEFREPWAVTTPEACQLARLLPLRTERVIPFHIIASGECWMELNEHPAVRLSEGDVVVLPYGDSHRLRGREPVLPMQVGSLLPNPPWTDVVVIEHGGAGPNTRIICGFLQCDELLFHPVLCHLPRLLHVSPACPADEWLASTVRHTAAQASSLRPGSRSLLPRLTELMFVEILRKYMQELPANEIGWFAAINDQVAGAGLRHMHAMPFHHWTVDSLARRVGVSRSVLAGRFKHFLDQPPMQYLGHWRLRLAAHALTSTATPIKSIACQTGYESEASFSRAFRRHFGVPPGDWRRRARSTSPAAASNMLRRPSSTMPSATPTPNT